MGRKYDWATDPRGTDDDAYFPGIRLFENQLYNTIAGVSAGMLLIGLAVADTYKEEIWNYINPPTTKSIILNQPRSICTGSAWESNLRCEQKNTEVTIQVPARTYGSLSELVSSWM